MKVKSFVAAIFYGAAITLGSIGMQKGIEVAKDPYKRAKVKKIFNKIKDELK